MFSKQCSYHCHRSHDETLMCVQKDNAWWTEFKTPKTQIQVSVYTKCFGYIDACLSKGNHYIDVMLTRNENINLAL